MITNRHRQRERLLCSYCGLKGHTDDKCWDKEDDEKASAKGKSDNLPDS